jgi:hypothetical protein
MGHSQETGGLGQFALPDLRQLLSIFRVVAWLQTSGWAFYFTQFPVRTGDQDGRMAVICCQPEDATRTAGFIIRMGVHRQ